MSFKCIKIGIRSNLIYPSMFLLFINIVRIDIILIEVFLELNTYILYPLLEFICTLILSFGFLYIQNKHHKSNKKSKILGITLIETKKEMKRLDKEYKIVILVFLSSYFDFLNLLRRFYFRELNFEHSELKETDMKIRSREILFASLLCYYALGIKLYKHHIISLIIICICLILSLIIEIIQMSKMSKMSKMNNKIIFIIYYIIMEIIITICRVFSDTVHKYLFEYNYIDPIKILRFQSVIKIILISFFYYGLKDDIESIVSKNLEVEDKFLLIFLLLIYSFASGFKNIYKILTVKTYSPMTRTLVDTFLDIFFYIYYFNSTNENNKYDEFYYLLFIIDLIVKIIIIFFNCVYNELFVLYCVGMEKDTYYGISQRAKLNIELPDKLINEDRDTIF